jgi:hypothetical protein
MVGQESQCHIWETRVKGKCRGKEGTKDQNTKKRIEAKETKERQQEKIQKR